MLAGAKETYVNKRTADAKRLRPVPAEPREGETEDDALAKAAQIVPVLAGVEKKSDDGQEAEAAAFIVRSSIHKKIVPVMAPVRCGIEHRGNFSWLPA